MKGETGLPSTGMNVAPEILPLIPGNVDTWRLLRMLDGSVEIMLENASAFDARAVDGELHVIGRVVVVVRTI